VWQQLFSNVVGFVLSIACLASLMVFASGHINVAQKDAVQRHDNIQHFRKGTVLPTAMALRRANQSYRDGNTVMHKK
jgi:hypothetical protein